VSHALQPRHEPAEVIESAPAVAALTAKLMRRYAARTRAVTGIWGSKTDGGPHQQLA
jgi:hypothetical protein